MFGFSKKGPSSNLRVMGHSVDVVSISRDGKILYTGDIVNAYPKDHLEEDFRSFVWYELRQPLFYLLCLPGLLSRDGRTCWCCIIRRGWKDREVPFNGVGADRELSCPISSTCLSGRCTQRHNVFSPQQRSHQCSDLCSLAQ